jgi:hypothetical protein
MTFLTSLIVGVVSGIIIMLASYFAIWRFTHFERWFRSHSNNFCDV